MEYILLSAPTFFTIGTLFLCSRKRTVITKKQFPEKKTIGFKGDHADSVTTTDTSTSKEDPRAIIHPILINQNYAISQASTATNAEQSEADPKTSSQNKGYIKENRLSQQQQTGDRRPVNLKPVERNAVKKEIEEKLDTLFDSKDDNAELLLQMTYINGNPMMATVIEDTKKIQCS